MVCTPLSLGPVISLCAVCVMDDHSETCSHRMSWVVRTCSAQSTGCLAGGSGVVRWTRDALGHANVHGVMIPRTWQTAIRLLRRPSRHRQGIRIPPAHVACAGTLLLVPAEASCHACRCCRLVQTEHAAAPRLADQVGALSCILPDGLTLRDIGTFLAHDRMRWQHLIHGAALARRPCECVCTSACTRHACLHREGVGQGYSTRSAHAREAGSQNKGRGGLSAPVRMR